jgi:hypothetical protein
MGHRFKNKIVIENFPSMMEIFVQLNTFLEKKNYPKDYESDHVGNKMHFLFNNPVNIKDN